MTIKQEKKICRKDACYFCMFSQNANLYGWHCHLCKLDRQFDSSERTCASLVLKAKQLWVSYSPLSKGCKPSWSQRKGYENQRKKTEHRSHRFLTPWHGIEIDGKASNQDFVFRLVNLPGSLELSAVSPAFKIKACMSICPDGQGICKWNKNNLPCCSSVSRDEGLVCFPPLNQSFTICWACWQLPSVANSLRDMTFAPRYQDTASRITTTKHVLEVCSQRCYLRATHKRRRKQDRARVWRPRWRTNHQSSERRKSTQGTPAAATTGEYSTLQVLGNTLWFLRDINKCKALRDCRREARIKR